MEDVKYMIVQITQGHQEQTNVIKDCWIVDAMGFGTAEEALKEKDTIKKREKFIIVPYWE